MKEPCCHPGREPGSMNSKTWADPDDAPDLSRSDLTVTVWQVAGHTVTAEEGIGAMCTAVTRGKPQSVTDSETSKPQRSRGFEQ